MTLLAENKSDEVWFVRVCDGCPLSECLEANALQWPSFSLSPPCCNMPRQACMPNMSSHHLPRLCSVSISTLLQSSSGLFTPIVDFDPRPNAVATIAKIDIYTGRWRILMAARTFAVGRSPPCRSSRPGPDYDWIRRRTSPTVPSRRRPGPTSGQQGYETRGGSQCQRRGYRGAG
jgi:hypothetical protein